MTFELGARDRKLLSARLTGGRGGLPVAVQTADGDIELPAPAQRAVQLLLTELAAGHTVHVLTDDHDLTTQQVAELLGLSRTFVVRLIDEGKIPAHLAGTHRRVRAADALAYERHRRARVIAVEQIATADAEAGVAYR